jgi:hypothetical protein
MTPRGSWCARIAANVRPIIDEIMRTGVTQCGGKLGENPLGAAPA